jgi:hypothetical protein
VGKLLLEISVRELHNDLLDTPENGGLAEARDESGNVLISDTALRYLLPPQLKRMSASHKQMCGCEKCLSIRTLQQSLNAWRFRCLRQLSVEANSLPEGEARQLALARLADYRSAVLVDDKPIHPKPKIALKSIQCTNVNNFNFLHWNCVLRQCSVCPQYPIHVKEQRTNNDAPTISFHVYLPVTNCTQHGRLPERAKTCPSCEADGHVGKKGKVRTRKHLTLLSRPIGTSLKEFYLPALDAYAYHRPHFYTRPTEPLPTVVRMQQVVSSKVELESISEMNKLPHTCDRRTATRLGAKRISNEDHDEMLEEIHRREALEFDEERDEEDELDSDESESGRV